MSYEELQMTIEKLNEQIERLTSSDVALPIHPEPHTYTWTDDELKTIEDYGARRAAAERERIANYLENLSGWLGVTEIADAIRKGAT